MAVSQFFSIFIMQATVLIKKHRIYAINNKKARKIIYVFHYLKFRLILRSQKLMIGIPLISLIESVMKVVEVR